MAAVLVPDTKISTSMPLFSVMTPASAAFSVRYFAPASEKEMLVLKMNVILFVRSVGVYLFFSGKQFDRLSQHHMHQLLSTKEGRRDSSQKLLSISTSDFVVNSVHECNEVHLNLEASSNSIIFKFSIETYTNIGLQLCDCESNFTFICGLCSQLNHDLNRRSAIFISIAPHAAANTYLLGECNIVILSISPVVPL